MGTWGKGPFDNDTACDWGGALSVTTDLSFIEQTLDQVLDIGSKYLDGYVAREAIAACEVVVRLRDGEGAKDAYTATVDEWIEKGELVPSSELVTKALAAIDRIMHPPSELLELWSDGPGFLSWKREMDRLKYRLSA
jgi:hypothetical protein